MFIHPRHRHPQNCTFEKACYAIWLVRYARLTQSRAGRLLDVSSGTINHIIHGRRFPNAYPVPYPGV